MLGTQGAISLKYLGGEMGPQLVYFVLEKELRNFCEMAPGSIKMLLMNVFKHLTT